MNAIATVINRARAQARGRRADLFRATFRFGRYIRILDLGSGDGRAIALVLEGTAVSPSNVYIADVDAAAVSRGQRRFGFRPVAIRETGGLPFDKGFFDIVHCSSVIEHVTVPKDDVWRRYRPGEFAELACAHQRQFAAEIRRVGRAYFVQTPNKWFPIESHTWLPLVGYLPRPLLVPVLRATNRLWIKRTAPDWHLLSGRDMARLFPEATIYRERFLGLTKSLVAIRK